MAHTQTRSSSSKAAPPLKSAVKKAPAKAAHKPAVPRADAAKGDGNGDGISAEQRYSMIAEAAYFIAEKRGFAPGDPARDWAEAEAQIDRKLNS